MSRSSFREFWARITRSFRVKKNVLTGALRRQRRIQLRLERLETRIAPTADMWIGGNGNWNTAANWSAGVPVAGENVQISGSVNVTISSGAQQANSVTCSNGATLTLSGGSVTATSGITIQNSILDFNGGNIYGTVDLVGSTLNIGTGSTGAASFVLQGSDTLSGNVAAGQTLWVQGNGAAGNATLTDLGNVTNHGTILLESTGSYYADTLATGSGTFTNAADGTIQVTNNSGGSRTISGTLVNQGSISVDGASYLTIQGTYYAAGGSITGPGYLLNTALYVTASPSSPTTIQLEGSGDTLETNNLANTTLWVQGNGYINQNATLNVAAGLVNHGTILLESTGSYYADTLATGSGTFTNAADGTIQVTNNSGGSRTISGNLVNEGTVNFDTSTTLGSTGATDANYGLISIAGSTVTVAGASFTNYVGGLISGDGTFNTSGISLVNNGIIDLSRPSILGVNAQQSSVAITYDDAGAMNAATVTNPANYTLLGSGGDGIFGNGNDVNESGLISQVTYNATTKTATLQLSSLLPPDVYWVEVNGSAVLDASGTPLLAGQTDLVNRVVGVLPAVATVNLDPASDSGAPDHPGFTNVTTPTFDVQVNQTGTIAIDFEGNGTYESTLSVPVAGTYKLTAPQLADGTYTAKVTFNAASGLTGQSSTTYTIDTTPPTVTSLSPAGTIYSGVSQATVTFSEPVDLNSFAPSAITLTGPNGTIAVGQPQLVSGSTYSISFAPQTVQGSYTLTLSSTIADFAGNTLTQPFTGSFTVALPDLAVTTASAPSSAVEGSSIPLSWTVENLSPTNPAISTWTDTVYLSSHAVLDNTATALTSVGAPPQSPLAGLGTYSFNVTATLPSNIATGNYCLLFVANANGGQLESDASGDTNDLFAEPITILPTAQTSLSVDPASDSGAPNHPGFTNVTTPTFDVQVNQAGTITMDFDGNTAHDQTVTVTAAGTYQFTAPTLADGAYTATATLNAGVGGSAQSSANFVIDTVGPHVTSISPTGTIHISATQVTVTFSEPVDLNTFTPTAITLTGPNGPISVNQPQLVSGSTYSIGFAAQITDGVYTLTIAPSVTDFAGNEMDQNQNGINGEPTDSFTGSFTMNLPVGGPIILNTPTLGFVPANKVDDWTFFGRAGQAITTVVDPGAPGTTLPPPPLDYVQLTLLDSNGNSLGTISNTQSGASAALSSITLPTDGIYHVQIQASAANPGSTGFYNLTVADATVHQTAIAFNEPVTGQLEDQYSSDQWTFSAVANQVVQFDLLNAANPDVEFDLTGPNGYTAFIDATASSGKIVLPTAGTYTLTVHTIGQPGAYAFEFMQSSVINLALNTPQQMSLAGSGQAQLYAVTVGAANPLEISLTDANQADHNEVYVSYGTIPTRDSYQYRYTGGAAANQTVVLTAKPGTYFVLVYNNLVTSPGNYTIEAQSAPFLLSGMNPTKIGNAGNTTVQLSGVFPLQTGNGGYVFSDAPTVQLIDANGTAYPVSPIALIPPPFGTVGGSTGGVNPDGTMTVSAVIPGSMLLPGIYSVRVTDDSGYSQTLKNVLTVVQGGLGILKTNVIVPNPIGYHVSSIIYVQYSNVGDAPLAAPLLVLTATQNGKQGALMTLDASKQVSGFWTSATPDGYSQSVQFLASGAMPGILQPGESETVPVYYAGWLTSQWDFSRPPIDFSLGVLDTSNTQTIDWASLQSSLQPSSLSPSAWNALYPNLTTRLGSTWGQYVQQLDNDAEYLGSLGENVTDIGQLFGFEVQQANGYSPLSTLASATDAQVAAPGLPLSFARTFAPGIIARNQFGIFGWGWSDSWDTSLTVDPDGSVNVLGPNGSLRRFQPDSRGGYFDQPGDHGTLAALPGGGYTLTELDGQVTAYNPNGTLNFVKDTNGNTITASYINGLLTKLTHSSGQFLALTYNAAGLVSTITDSAGRTTTYNYDPTNQYLTSVVDFDGQTTSYTYDTGTNPAAAHALLSVTHSDGSHDYFSYDSEGRLSDAHRDGGAEDTTFAYNEGQVSATDALNDTTRYFIDNRGLLVQVENPLQNTVHYTYDNNFNLIQTTDAAGQVYTNTYDNYGDVTSSTDPLGHTVTYTYNCANDTLASVTDGNGNTTLYAYDGKGNLTSTTYADGTVESVAYDPIGNLLSSTDRMGQVTQYTHDAAGNILTETFADGSKVVFTYDAHENLTSATNSSGTTLLTYDANDRLIQITYPSGHYLKYSYDAAGRRIQMVDDTGFTVNYGYDALDNLATLADGSGNLIVQYTYDAAGRLSREDHGNGTYVIYTYDAAAELLHVVNYAPNGMVNSRFDYTYDSLGRRITEATLDGTWTYSYDAVGELTHAVFVSTNPAIANQDLAYSYDAAGNRTQAVINGVTTAYTTNNLNEYTQVGGTTYTYNADGDMTSATDASGTTNYTYNVQNQLVGVTGPSGSWAYSYDALGNHVATTQNGKTTQYLIDRTGFGNVVGEYNSSGGVIATYVYGVGLVSQVTSGSSYYYAFDASGSTVNMTNISGQIVASYSYLPFGAILIDSGNAHNPFLFSGKLGVMEVSGGLYDMRTREYAVSSGQFLTSDPLGLWGGDINTRRYAHGDPVDYADPAGLEGNLVGLLVAVIIYSITGQPLTPDQTEFVNTVADAVENWSKDAEEAVKLRFEIELANDINNFEALKTTIPLENGTATIEADASASTGGVSRFLGPIGLFLTIILTPSEIGPEPDPNPSVNPTGSGSNTTSVNSHDPNSKTGPAGYGSEDFVSDDTTFPYRIDFENDPTASAPAQRVDITDQLDPNLDWSTFQWTGFGFGNTVIPIPPNTQHYETTVPMTYNGVTFRVVITLDLDPQTGMVHASFQSLNAANLMTGAAQCPGTLSLGPSNPEAELPPPVTIGFLPPEDGTGRGMGYLTYTVKPKSDLTTGTQIRNVADVTFDLGTTIATDQVSETDPTQGVDPTKQDLVTIDSAPPMSSVAALPSVSSTNAFTVSWSGQDDPGGSGIASYNIYVSNNGGAFTPWLTNTTQTSATYIGQDGHTYGFYSIVTDNVGNVQPTPTAAQATTTVDAAPPTSSVAALPQFSPGTFTLSWSGSDLNGVGIASYSVYVSDNGGAFAPLLTNTTQTSTTFTGINGHSYGFYSVATDNLGNIQPAPTSAQATTTVDTVAPTSSVAPLPALVLPTFTVSWSGSDNPGGSGLAYYTIYFSDNGGAFTPLLTDTRQTSTTFTGVDGHTYSFYSIAADNVGNVQPTPPSAQASTTVDATPPTSSVAALPAFSPGSFLVSWSGSDGNGSGIADYNVYVSDNGGAFTPLLTNTTQTSTTFAGVNGHTYGFYSVATDNVGNVQPTPASAQTTTTIDNVAPTSSVTALATFNAATFTVSWSGSDNPGGSGLSYYTIYVSDNGGAFAPLLTGTTKTSTTFTGVSGHSYGFYSVATDNVGNVQPTPSSAQASTTVDTVAPTSNITALPTFSPATITVSWSGSDGSGSGIASYSIYESDNGGAFTPLLTNTTQTSTTFTGVNGHSYGFYSVATDNVGNVQATPTSAQASTTVDATPPTTSVAALPSFSPGSFTLNWSGSDGNGSGIAGYNVYVSDNGGAFTPLLTNTKQTSTTFTGVNGHTYGFYSVATDNVGNVQPTPTAAQASTTIDTAPPTSSVAALPTFSPSTFTVSWSGSDNPGGSGLASFSIYVSDNGGNFTPLLTNTTQTSTTFTGVTGHTYGFYSVATDNVGNIQPTPTVAQATTTVSVSAPSLSVVSTSTLSVLQGETTTSVLLATFTQGSATQLAGAYTATVAWGDGQSDTSTESNSPISIQVSGQTISVYGKHTYTTTGPQNLSVTLSTTGASATAYPTATVAPNVSRQISSSASGLVYNRATQLFGGTITLTNTGTTNLTGTLMVELASLPSGVTLNNASGTAPDGNPYILVNLPNGILAPGKSVTFNVYFRNPNKLSFSYGLTTFDETTNG